MFIKIYYMEFIMLQDHDVHNIIIYNIVSHNSLFLFCFLDITHFVGICEYISSLIPVGKIQQTLMIS